MCSHLLNMYDLKAPHSIGQLQYNGGLHAEGPAAPSIAPPESNGLDVSEAPAIAPQLNGEKVATSLLWTWAILLAQ